MPKLALCAPLRPDKRRGRARSRRAPIRDPSPTASNPPQRRGYRDPQCRRGRARPRPAPAGMCAVWRVSRVLRLKHGHCARQIVYSRARSSPTNMRSGGNPIGTTKLCELAIRDATPFRPRGLSGRGEGGNSAAERIAAGKLASVADVVLRTAARVRIRKPVRGRRFCRALRPTPIPDARCYRTTYRACADACTAFAGIPPEHLREAWNELLSDVRRLA